MRQLLILIIFFSVTLSALGQTFERINNETADAFVKRITQLEELPHPVIETREWDKTRKVIIYFSIENMNSDEENIIGYLLVPSTGLNYKQVLIDTFYQEGNNPNIETVFFANADKDKEREIVIQTSWLQHHRGTGTYGTLYGTYIYEAPNLASPQKKLQFFTELSKKLDGGFEGESDGQKLKAKYKTVKSIRLALKNLGY